MRGFPTDVAGLPALITILRGLTPIYFSTADRPLTHPTTSVVYPQGPGAKITGVQFTSDGSFSNADISLLAQPGGIIAPGQGARGYLDNWPITVELIDPNSPTVTYPLINGTVGSVNEDSDGNLTIAANGLLRFVQHRPMCEHYQLTGREDLGDDRCKVPICCVQDETFYDIQRNRAYVLFDIPTGLLAVKDCYGKVRQGASDVTGYNNVVYQCTTAGTTAGTAPVYPTSPGATVTDGSATFTCLAGWTIATFGQATDPFTIQLESLPDARASDPTWYVYGGLFFRSGNLDGFPKVVIRAWDPGSLTLTTALPMAPGDVPAHTLMEIHPGCDLTQTMCFVRFNNIINVRAEFFIPLPDTMFL